MYLLLDRIELLQLHLLLLVHFGKAANVDSFDLPFVAVQFLRVEVRHVGMLEESGWTLLASPPIFIRLLKLCVELLHLSLELLLDLV